MISLPESITELSEGCFANCVSLESIDIPDSVIKVGKECFNGSGINTITLGKHVEEVGEKAFASTPIPLHIKFRGNEIPTTTNPFDRQVGDYNVKYSTHLSVGKSDFTTKG
jgi:hypothetical protein